MQKDLSLFTTIISIGLVLGFLFGTLYGDNVRKTALHKDFVKTECARFNPVTAKFEYIIKN